MIEVGISDLNVATQDEILITRALGSCVGICLYDSIAKVAGMSHIMLPDSIPFAPEGRQEYKFADTAIPILVQKMEEKGAALYRSRFWFFMLPTRRVAMYFGLGRAGCRAMAKGRLKCEYPTHAC